MNNQFSPGSRPEVKPAIPAAGVANITPGARGEIIFHRPPLTGTEDPTEVIERGKIVGIEERLARVLEAIGAS